MTKETNLTTSQIEGLLNNISINDVYNDGITTTEMLSLITDDREALELALATKPAETAGEIASLIGYSNYLKW